MKPSEAAVVLGRAAGTDNRVPTEAAALAWAESLDDRISLRDALAAVTAHYAETREFVMPSDVNHRVRAMWRERVRADGTPDIPAGLEYHQEQAWRLAYHDQIRQGDTRAESTAAANLAIGHTPAPEIERPSARAVEGQARKWSAPERAGR
jgi:hypothetical protein